ncbi:MAG TPA: hypothetical protein VGE30_01450, partial [Candidatus Saccharimonadales bacterium]
GALAFMVGVIILLFSDSLVTINLMVPIMIFGVLGGCVWAFYKIYEQNRRQHEALSRFALANNISYDTNVFPGLAGLMFQEGGDRLIRSRLIIPTDAHPVEIGNYQYTTGSGKSETTHDLGYMRLKLPRRVPHMVLDAKANNFMSRFSNLPAAFDKRQVLELEGDFNNYFTLYAPEQYERDALYVFTPDVMQALVDLAGNYDVELVDDDLFVYSSQPFVLARPETLQALLTLASRLSPEFTSQTDRYADERIANFNANIIAEPGRRLKKRFAWVGIAIFVTYLSLSIGKDFAPDNLQFALYSIFGMAIWAFVIWALVRKFRGIR